jgi:hypothetical protein
MYATLSDDSLGYAWTYPAACLTIGLIVFGVWLVSLLATRFGGSPAASPDRAVEAMVPERATAGMA